MNATALRRRKARADPQPLKMVEVTVPRATLEAAEEFARHFGLTPEMVMEGQFYMELESFGDDLLEALVRADQRPPIADPVTVQLSILAEAMELTAIAAKVLNRPLGWLVTLFVEGGTDLVWRQMKNAEEEGNLADDTDVQDQAKTIFSHSMCARAGKFPKTCEYDAWVQLGIDRPKKKGGSARA
ncbi:hypothetical protein [Luteolibacter soli]|uniref:Tail assembly chaperone n=1 Tax=Luteolibacter soli TaxID=3135280 RepID=A0ABU9AYF8_9BACT